MKTKAYKSLFLISIIIFSISCNYQSNSIINQFDILTNFKESMPDTVVIKMDLSDVITNGIELPSNNTKNNFFKFKFKIKPEEKKLYYKIYYQNESYKFPEVEGNNYNTLASENFYGSWENISDTFKLIDINKISNDEIFIEDSFKIIGNPRDEKKFYGAKIEDFEINQENINKIIKEIKNSPEWFKSIKTKAEQAKRTIDEQLYLDALWVLNDKRNKGNANHRWKRNPRAGNYKFMLVITTDDALNHIPEYIRDIGKINENKLFVNPFYYFIHGDGSKLSGVYTMQSKKILNVKAELSMSSGIYVDVLKINQKDYDTTFYTKNCNDKDEMFRKAHFAQYFHYINKDFHLKNIPVIADVINEPYTYNQYQENLKKYNENNLLTDYPKNTDCPCKTVKSDTAKSEIILTNPGNDNIKNAKKEHVGIISRIGFTYGKITAKIKFPEQLNSENVWNGITNAFWLIYQDEAPWNQRRICSKEGYIPKDKNGKDENVRVPILNYSEIDFEIVKTSKYWPETSYHRNQKVPTEDAGKSNEIIIACTNWDMACKDPQKFGFGVFDVNFLGKNLVFHRWDWWYKAVTYKHPIIEDEISKNDFYYYQIDWQTDKIYWRIGTDKNNLTTIAYIDADYSVIPNNQMVFVVTQEWHYSAWWPTAPFKQDYIPYPKTDIVGRVMEITIE